MATLADVRTSIALRLQDPSFTSITSANVDAFINDAIRYYKNQQFWFNEAQATIALTQGTSTISTIPSDFLVELVPDGLTISYSNMFYPLTKVSSAEFDIQNFNGSGLPYIYTFRNSAFEVYYLPSLAYTLVLRYLKDYNTLVADSDTNDWIKYTYQMIMYNALSRICGEIKQDSKMEDYYTSRAADEENQIKKRSFTKTGTGTLTIHSIL